MLVLVMCIWHFKKDGLRKGLASPIRYHIAHRRYYPIWLLCLLSVPISAVMGALFIPAGFYHFQAFLYQPENALLLPAYNLYPDAILFASTGMLIWSCFLKALLTFFFKKTDAACALFNVLILNKWIEPEKNIGLSYRRCLQRMDVSIWARTQWQIWVKLFLAFWMIGGLWSLMELNHYIKLTPTHVRINRFWDLNEKIYSHDTFVCTQQAGADLSPQQTHIIIKFNDGLQWDLMRSSNAYGLSTPVLSDLEGWIAACKKNE